MSQLLREQVEETRLVKGKDKSYYITGIFMQAEVQNRNGRVYPLAVLQKATQQFNETYIRPRRAVGELGHPDGPTVNQERISHVIEDMHQEGNDFVGKAKIIVALPYGAIVKALLDEGVQFGVSTRGMGSVRRENGVDVIQDDFQLVTVDIVHDPSAPEALVSGIMEKREWIWKSGAFTEKELDEAKKTIQRTSMNYLEGETVKLFEQHMQRLMKR